MPPKVRQRDEARVRLEEQLKQAQKLLQLHEAIGLEEVVGSRGGDHIIREKRNRHRTARDKWRRSTGVILQKYFDSTEYSVEFANAAQEVGGYGNLSFDPVSYALRKGADVIESIIHVLNDLEDVSITEDSEVPLQTNYVETSRIAAFRSHSDSKFDLSRLIQLCDELNISHRHQCYLSVITTVRSILNHIPPIFGKRTFQEVANNYGGKSFKDITERLENTSRKIADYYIHTAIRKSESLPTANQVDFRQDLDFVLGEVLRLLKGQIEQEKK